MIPFLAFALGLLFGLAVAGGFWFLGYRLAQQHERQVNEYNGISGTFGR